MKLQLLSAASIAKSERAIQVLNLVILHGTVKLFSHCWISCTIRE